MGIEGDKKMLVPLRKVTTDILYKSWKEKMFFTFEGANSERKYSLT